MQHAMHLASHSDPRVHARYVMRTAVMRTIPEAALPRLPRGLLTEPDSRDDSTPSMASEAPGNVTACDDSSSDRTTNRSVVCVT